MIAISDDIEFAKSIFDEWLPRWELLETGGISGIDLLTEKLFAGRDLLCAHIDNLPGWSYMLISRSAEHSQYDIVNQLCQENVGLPHGILCFAGEGRSFHGFKNRSWSAPSGNIYLTAFFAPDKPIKNFGAGFMALAAVSVVETVDSLAGLNKMAGIKWINDIFIDGAKVGGVLAHSHQEGEKLTGVALGIGLNVGMTPSIEPTFYVPKTTSLYDHCENKTACSQPQVLFNLIESLDRNYRILSEAGYKDILQKYCQRSLVIGREVEIRPDNENQPSEILASGLVKSIGDGLELYIEGIPAPVTHGRLILK